MYSKALITARGGHCSICNTTQKLLIHHIDSDRNNNIPTNLEILCQTCHAKKHKKQQKTIEHTLMELLKTMTVEEAAKELNTSISHINQTLCRIRNKIEKDQNTLNVAANWMKHKRPAKLLRRQEATKKEES
uniref:Putative HNH endonuclease n=1 Tax=viral metagenome TaxID=1070528 RepID=A0A6M3M9V2_9ZZZZ